MPKRVKGEGTVTTHSRKRKGRTYNQPRECITGPQLTKYGGFNIGDKFTYYIEKGRIQIIHDDYDISDFE
jgi:hypothetical protein